MVLYQLGILDDIADSDCPSRYHYLFYQNEEKATQQQQESSQQHEQEQSQQQHEKNNTHNHNHAYVAGYYGNDFTEGNDGNSGWGQRGNLRVPRQTRILFIIHATPLLLLFLIFICSNFIIINIIQYYCTSY